MTKRFAFLTFLFFFALYISSCSPSEQKQVSTELYPADPENTGANEFVVSQIESEQGQIVSGDSNEIQQVSASDFHEKAVEILKNFVDDKGMVKYQELRKKRVEFNLLLEEFKNLDPDEYKSWPLDDKKAFWINIYNLQKIKVVADNYPIQSSRFLRVLWGINDLRHIESDISEHKFLVMDEEFTFQKIVNRFFKQEFDDARLFIALSDACLSSPPLRDEPYYGDRIEEQLEDQAEKFLSSPLAFKIEKNKKRLYLSAIFEPGRFGKEFQAKYSIDRKFKDHPPAVRAVLNFISQYISDQDVSFLEVGNYSVSYMTYDWTINDSS